MKANPTKKPPKATPKPPKATTTQTKAVPGEQPPAAAPTPAPTPAPLAGVTIRADALTYAPDYHRARIHITTPTGRYYKLVVRHVA